MSTACLLALTLAATGDKPVLAVMYFDNQTGSAEFDVMRKGLADMLVTDLAAYEGVTLVERSRLEDVLGELKLQRGTAFDASSRAKVGKLLGAQYMVVGEFAIQGTASRLSARLVEAATGKVVGSAKVDSDRDHLFEAEQKLVESLVVAIELKLVDSAARRRAKVSSLDALMKYSVAVDLADQGKLTEAQKAIDALVSSSPTSALARDRKAAIAKALLDSQSRRQTTKQEALNALVESVETRLKEPASANEEVALRALRHRLLGVALTAHLASNTSHRKLVLPGHDAQALAVVRTTLDNFNRWSVAYQKAIDGAFNPQLPNNIGERVPQAGLEFGSSAFADPFEARLRFALLGSHEGFAFGPVPATLVTGLEKTELDALDAQLAVRQAMLNTSANKTVVENQLVSVFMLKGDLLVELERDELAAQAYQRVLDSLPGHAQASRAEAKIKEIIDGGDYRRQQLERWRRGLTGCDDMDLNVGTSAAMAVAEQRAGRAGLRTMVEEAEKACLTKKRRSLGAVYRQAAHEAAAQNDCALLDEAYQKAIGVGESKADAVAYAERWPQCPMAWLKDTPLARFTEDLNWSRELPEVEVRTAGGRHTFVGKVPSGVLSQTFTLVVEPSGTCRVTWNRPSRPDGAVLTSSVCEAQVSRAGPWVEVTFSATLPTGKRPVELTRGLFRARAP
jgi:TolB-like protein